MPGEKTRVRKVPLVFRGPLRSCIPNRAAICSGRRVDVVLNECFGKAPRPTRDVEDEGTADLHLASGELVVGASLPVGIGEPARDDRAPTVEESLDVSGAEAAADPLEEGWILTGGEAAGGLAEVEPGAIPVASARLPDRGRRCTP